MSLEQKIEELTEAVKVLTAVMNNPPIVVGPDTAINTSPGGITVPGSTEPILEVIPPTTKKKAKAKKKKAEVKAEPEITPEVVAPVAEATSTVTREDIIHEVRKNVVEVAPIGDDAIALAIINRYQNDATLKTLSEEHFEAVYTDIVAANQKGMEA